jgi:ubiquinone/menaquinone biosynthesis C-methylase UbiE
VHQSAVPMTATQPVRAGSNRRASSRQDETLYPRLEQEVHRLLVKLLDSHEPVLEIGCGDCRHADRLARAVGFRVVGVDINAEVLPRKSRRRSGAECMKANAELLPGTFTEHFGGAVARFVIHELDHPKLVLRVLSKVMTPGGIVALVDPVKGSVAEQLYKEEYYTPGQLAGFLRWAGFSDIECTLLGNGNLALVVGRKARRLDRIRTARRQRGR